MGFSRICDLSFHLPVAHSGTFGLLVFSLLQSVEKYSVVSGEQAWVSQMFRDQQNWKDPNFL